MKKFDVQMAFETVKEARQQWDTAREKYRGNERVVLRRLLHESALNRLSVEDVAQFSGLTPTRVRALMREFGLDPRKSRSLLAKSAADALAVNSEMLGVAPHEVDLTSPLAYLPMGEQLREQLTEARIHRVTELADGVSVNGVREALTESADEAEEFCHLNHDTPCTCFTVIKQLRNKAATL